MVRVGSVRILRHYISLARVGGLNLSCVVVLQASGHVTSWR